MSRVQIPPPRLPGRLPMHFVYILYSPGSDRFYVGETADPDQRLAHHRAGQSRYTRRAADWVRVFLMSTPTQRDAKIVEQRIKRSKSRASIVRWIQGSDNREESHTWKDFAW